MPQPLVSGGARGSMNRLSHAPPSTRCTRGACGVIKAPCNRRSASRVVARASIIDDVDFQFSALDKQFQDMSKEFQNVDRELAAIDRQFADVGRELSGFERQIERDIDDVFLRTQTRLEQQQALLREELERQQAIQAQAPGTVYFSSQEGGGSSSFSYYRSYTLSINSGEPITTYAAPPTAAAGPISPLVLVAALLASAHAAVAATFIKNFHLTTYQPKARWSMAIAWPVLAIFNPSFRGQFFAALQGQKATVLRSQDGDQEGASGGAAEAR